MSQTPELFDLDTLADSVTGTPGNVTIVYGTSYNIRTPSGDLTLTGNVATGAAVGTVREVFEKTGAVAEFKRIEAALREKGHPQTEGYSISITNADGSETLRPTDLDAALDTEVHDGDLIAVIGKVGGRSQ